MEFIREFSQPFEEQVPMINRPQITEWVFATFLSFQHRILRFEEAQRNCVWAKQAPDVEDSIGLRM